MEALSSFRNLLYLLPLWRDRTGGLKAKETSRRNFKEAVRPVRTPEICHILSMDLSQRSQFLAEGVFRSLSPRKASEPSHVTRSRTLKFHPL